MSDHQNECQELMEAIKKNQEEKTAYFREVLEGKHPGKKLYQQKFILQFAEVIDYDKTKLVYEESEADEKANQEYLKSCSHHIDKAALLFANEIQKHETFSIEEFSLFGREYEPCSLKNVTTVDLKNGKIDNIEGVPSEVVSALEVFCKAAKKTGGEREQEKAAEATAAV